MYNFHIPVSHAVTDPIDGKDSIQDRCPGTDGDQTVHVRASVPQCLEAVLKVLLVRHKDRQKQ